MSRRESARARKALVDAMAMAATALVSLDATYRRDRGLTPRASSTHIKGLDALLTLHESRTALPAPVEAQACIAQLVAAVGAVDDLVEALEDAPDAHTFDASRWIEASKKSASKKSASKKSASKKSASKKSASQKSASKKSASKKAASKKSASKKAASKKSASKR